MLVVCDQRIDISINSEIVTLELLRMQWAAPSHSTLAMRCSQWPLRLAGADHVARAHYSFVGRVEYHPNLLTSRGAPMMYVHFQQQEESSILLLLLTENPPCIMHSMTLTPLSSSLYVLFSRSPPVIARTIQPFLISEVIIWDLKLF